MEDTTYTEISKCPPKISMALYNVLLKTPSIYFKVCAKDTDIGTWYILLSNVNGANDEFTGGEYLVRLKLPAADGPPVWKFLTPQGVFDVNKQPCTTVSVNHPTSARMGAGYEMYLVNALVVPLVSPMDIHSGSHVLDTSIEYKKQCAIESKEYNRKHYKSIIEQINTNFENYKLQWESIVESEEIDIEFISTEIKNTSVVDNTLSLFSVEEDFAISADSWTNHANHH